MPKTEIMNLLFYSPSFYPKTGGLETVVLYLAKELTKKGFNVKLITHTPLGNCEEIKNDFNLVRTNDKAILFKSYLWCDVFFHHNVSLNGVWPFLIWPFKKWVILHHLTYFNHQRISPLEQLKRQLSRLAYNISCSAFVNQTLPKKGKVIYNTYEKHIFYDKGVKRNPLSIVFVGRLVSDKGCDLLIASFKKLKEQFKEQLTLNIIGDGPDYLKLQNIVAENSLTQMVNFKGILKGKALNDELNLNQIIVIPSKWEEPFGIVCLEGIAAGCIPIFADRGGLLEAAGPLGKSFKSGDDESLKNEIVDVLTHYDDYYKKMNSLKNIHLQKFDSELIINEFENTLNSLH